MPGDDDVAGGKRVGRERPFGAHLRVDADADREAPALTVERRVADVRPERRLDTDEGNSVMCERALNLGDGSGDLLGVMATAADHGRAQDHTKDHAPHD